MRRLYIFPQLHFIQLWFQLINLFLIFFLLLLLVQFRLDQFGPSVNLLLLHLVQLVFIFNSHFVHVNIFYFYLFIEFPYFISDKSHLLLHLYLHLLEWQLSCFGNTILLITPAVRFTVGDLIRDRSAIESAHNYRIVAITKIILASFEFNFDWMRIFGQYSIWYVLR